LFEDGLGLGLDLCLAFVGRSGQGVDDLLAVVVLAAQAHVL
jgi:hypothetical protein